MTTTSLLTTVLNATGHDLRPGRTCAPCGTALDPDTDLTLRVLLDDGNVPESRTRWSDRVLCRAAHLCPRGPVLEAVLLARRAEGWRRGVVETIL